MSDKERLETIKEFVKKIESILYDEWRQQELTILIESLYYDDHVDWLINRVEKLEKEKDEWKDTAQSYYMTNQELREQNKRYRKAVNNIIEKAMLFGTNEEVYEAIQDAIKALEGDN